MTDPQHGLDEMLEYDRSHLWHPYTSITDPLPVYPVVSAKGVKIRLADGTELIDGMASWWSAIHGYNHPVLNEALTSQAGRMSHVMFGGLTHEPAVELARMLVEAAPVGLEKVFLADSGSVAVEVAMKMAMQYQYARGLGGKNKFLTIRSGYHGDTFHAMSVCDPVTGMHQIYGNVLPKYHFADKPKCLYHEEWRDSDMDSFKRIITEKHNDLCAVILEPIVQGAGGMRFYHPNYLRGVRALCDEHDVVLIADEIATGFGRTGKMFGCDHASISPDIMCLGKALTGGYMTLSAVLATAEIGETISSAPPHVFMHGPTFMANPLACSVAVASLSVLVESEWEERVADIEGKLRERLSPCSDMKGVAQVRALGAIGVVELERAVNMAEIQKAFVKRGVWVRPFGKLVYIMPPFCISDSELEYLCRTICEVVAIEVAA